MAMVLQALVNILRGAIKWKACMYGSGMCICRNVGMMYVNVIMYIMYIVEFGLCKLISNSVILYLWISHSELWTVMITNMFCLLDVWDSSCSVTISATFCHGQFYSAMHKRVLHPILIFHATEIITDFDILLMSEYNEAVLWVNENKPICVSGFYFDKWSRRP